MRAGIATRLDFSKEEGPIVGAAVPALSNVRQIGSQFALATFPSPTGPFWKRFCGHAAMDHLSAEMKLPSDSTLPQTCSMQGQDFLIASNARVPTPLASLFDKREGREWELRF